MVVNSNKYFLANFEDAIDGLRRGNIMYYNGIAIQIGIPEIEGLGIRLPALHNEDYEYNLKLYQDYCDKLTDKPKY